MKEGLSSLDVAALAAELRPVLVGARFEKAYQPAKDQVLLRLRRKGLGRIDLLFSLGRFVTVTVRPPANPDKPSMVAQILRTTLTNARVTGVAQVGFDRILRLDLERGDGAHAIVLEVFGDGNLLLLDGAGTIALPMRGGDYGARRLRKGEPYQPPPGAPDPLAMDRSALEAAGDAARRDVVRMLAVELGFGPLWAEELCLRAGIPKDARPADLGPDAWGRLHAAIAAIASEIARNDLAPAVVHEDGKPVDAVPFVMERYPPPRFAHEEATTFREALDRFFTGADTDEDAEEDPRQVRFDEAVGKLERQVGQMEEAIDRFEAEEADARRRGDALYASFQEAESMLRDLEAARADRSWAEVADVLRAGRAQGHEMASKVQELRPDKARATFVLTDVDGAAVPVEVDLRDSVQDNAERHYGAAKKARSRREGAAKALADVRGRLQGMHEKGLDAFGAAPRREEVVRRHFWFESYRWTLTPGGLVAVGGRNAAQNDAVVKKYLRDGDRYVHAQIHGAPSVVLRDVEGHLEPGPGDLRVACQFAACSSRAWRQFAHASAYWVTPQQVSKTPRSGEFVPRGAWIVHGRRNVEDALPMEWGVGRVRLRRDGHPVAVGEEAEGAVGKLAGGPPDGLRPFADDIVLLRPGDVGPVEAAQRIAERFQVGIEDAQAVLPPGPVAFR